MVFAPPADRRAQAREAAAQTQPLPRPFAASRRPSPPRRFHWANMPPNRPNAEAVGRRNRARNPMEPRRPHPRIYLVTAPVDDPAQITDALAAALDAGDVAAVLLRLVATDERTLINRVKVIAPVVQGRGAALLIDGHPQI